MAGFGREESPLLSRPAPSSSSSAAAASSSSRHSTTPNSHTSALPDVAPRQGKVEVASFSSRADFGELGEPDGDSIVSASLCLLYTAVWAMVISPFALLIFQTPEYQPSDPVVLMAIGTVLFSFLAVKTDIHLAKLTDTPSQLTYVIGILISIAAQFLFFSHDGFPSTFSLVATALVLASCFALEFISMKNNHNCNSQTNNTKKTASRNNSNNSHNRRDSGEADLMEQGDLDNLDDDDICYAKSSNSSRRMSSDL
eukprot:TRINITY_DN8199_c0_g1::TRINITY_DN8199_c0_g1_i1::g.7100::m.7100 TRINITY_DN8199_c0_g1::TRINITY_DN8199_c0_g1_i1::g.7100  ORF type:complete len:265 (+),score=36.84,DUF3429/PF11911.3/0.0038,7TMR-DISM_7TM/PF07695.6/0.0051,EcsB/PF05975.7/0.091,DUF4271/PF14093.1/1.8,DUF4271/PF14093.1/23,DUF4131/PF13567.1/54,DUF4131/PF13567.1/1.6 TRINITY_DN8199_c0_g1_i1:32-796(+)